MMKSGYSDANPIDKKLAYESEVENIVIGFSEDQEPIWLEILDVTKDFLPKLNKIKKNKQSPTHFLFNEDNRDLFLFCDLLEVPI